LELCWRRAWILDGIRKVRQSHHINRNVITCSLFSCDLPAENALRQEEQKPGFSLQLLQITASDSQPSNIRLASALCFKNFIKRSWTNEDGEYKLPLDEVSTIKRELITLMISVPPAIRTQLGEAVSVIADSDFWERWDTLVDVSDQWCSEVLVFLLTRTLLHLGPCFETIAIQPCRQHWCPPGCALHLQALATALPIQRALH